MRLLIAAGFTLAALAAAPFMVFEGSAQEEAPTAEYVGSATCKKCHFKEYRYWKKTKKIHAVDTLRPTTAEDDKELFDKKTKAELDPAKDYSKDAKCLACHTTGHGKPGGFPAEGAVDDDTMKNLGQVGCESCHGPGSLYVKHKTDEVAKDKKAKFTFEGLAKLGLVQPDAESCATCHSGKGPTTPAEAFDYEKMKKKVHSKKKKKK